MTELIFVRFLSTPIEDDRLLDCFPHCDIDLLPGHACS